MIGVPRVLSARARLSHLFEGLRDTFPGTHLDRRRWPRVLAPGSLEVDSSLARVRVDALGPFLRCRAQFVLLEGPCFAGGPSIGRPRHGLRGAIEAARIALYDGVTLDPPGIERTLSERARYLLARRVYTIDADGREIRVAVDAPRELDAARDTVEVAAELARPPAGVLDTMRGLPGARWFPPRGRFGERTRPYVEVDGEPSVGLTARFRDGAVRWVAWADAPLGPFRAETPHEAASLSLPLEARAVLEELDRAVLESRDGRVAISWLANELAPARVRCVVETIQALCRAPTAGLR